MTGCTAIGEARTNFIDQCDVARAITHSWSLALGARELALEQLTPPANGPKRVAGDDERRRIRRHDAAATSSNLLGERKVDPFIRWVRCLRLVDKLREDRHAEKCADPDHQVDRVARLQSPAIHSRPPFLAGISDSTSKLGGSLRLLCSTRDKILCRTGPTMMKPATVRCRNLVTPPGRTREPCHRDGRDAGHEPRPTPSPAATVGVSVGVD